MKKPKVIIGCDYSLGPERGMITVAKVKNGKIYVECSIETNGVNQPDWEKIAERIGEIFNGVLVMEK